METEVSVPDRPTSSAGGGAAGIIDGSRYATGNGFAVICTGEENLKVGEFVVSERVLSDGTPVKHHGLVVEFDPAAENTPSVSNPRSASVLAPSGAEARCAYVRVLCGEPHGGFLPWPCSPVYRASDKDRRFIAFPDAVGEPLPVGLDVVGEPLYVGSDYIVGTEGGVLSIGGFQTPHERYAYTLPVIHRLFGTPEGRAIMKDPDTRGIIFASMPGESLAVGGRDISSYAPPGTQDGAGTEATRKTNKKRPYGFTPWEIVREEMMDFLVQGSIDDPVSGVGFYVREQLLRTTHPHIGRNGELTGAAVAVEHPPTGPSLVALRESGRDREPRRADEGRLLAGFDDMADYIAEKLHEDPAWGGASSWGEVDAFVARLNALRKDVGPLIGCVLETVPLEEPGLKIVDIHGLHADARRFVVSVLLTRELRSRERMSGRDPLCCVVLDELERYAPRGGEDATMDLMLDLAERGSNLGMQLVVMHGSSDAVEERVLRNANVSISGAWDAAPRESTYAEPDERVARLSQGETLLRAPHLPFPIPVRPLLPPGAS